MIEKFEYSLHNYSDKFSWEQFSHIVPGVLLVIIPVLLRKKLAIFISNRLNFLLAKAKFTPKEIEKFTLHIAKPLHLIGFILSIVISTTYFNLNGEESLIMTIQHTVSVIMVFWILHACVDLIAIKLKKLQKTFSKAMIDLFLKALRILIIFLAIASVLELWGIQVAPILAGLGLFGVAIALGAQDLFKNLIAGILVIAEKRFEKHDWIKVDGVVEGTVEEIGFRSTKIVRFDKAPVFVPNTKLSESVVTNFSRMSHRRIRFTIGLLYSSTADQLRKVVNEINDYIQKTEELAKEEGLNNYVRVVGFNASSIDITIQSFTYATSMSEWIAIQENLLYKVKEIVEKAGADFAFPTNTIHFGDDNLEFMKTKNK